MARPKKFNADYFSHDCDMRNDVKLRNIRRKFGHEGYSLWNMLLEFLGDCDYFEYEWTDINIELLEPDFDMDADRIKEIVNHMIHLGLLQIKHGYLICENFSERLSDTLSSKRDSFRMENSMVNQIEQSFRRENSINFDENPQSKVKESKENKSKEENSKLEDSTLYERKAQDSIDEDIFSDIDTNIVNPSKVSKSFFESFNSGEITDARVYLNL